MTRAHATTAKPSLTPAQRRVAATLAEIGPATTAEISTLAGVSKSSVAKTLTLLESQQAAIRTVRELDGFREADLWSPGPALRALLSEGIAASEPERPTAGPTKAPAGPANSVAPESEAAPDSVPVHAPAPAQTTDRPAVEAGASKPLVSDPSTPAVNSGRLAPGELAGMVGAILTANPDVEYTSTMISHLLEGRSGGAINNALEKMVAAGTAVRTWDKPKRFRLAGPPVPNGA